MSRRPICLHLVAVSHKPPLLPQVPDVVEEAPEEVAPQAQPHTWRSSHVVMSPALLEDRAAGVPLHQLRCLDLASLGLTRLAPLPRLCPQLQRVRLDDNLLTNIHGMGCRTAEQRPQIWS